MGLEINAPFSSSLAAECKKCAKILASFIDPRNDFGPDKIIPPAILANAKGLAILTVVKAGFVGSARMGTGLVIARLPDGGWSAPSAIATAGAGLGGQIGFELTDFVFILNDANAVKTFAQQGSITLGTNVSIAAGPVGRNAEAAGAASLRSVAAIFSYSKTKGLFAGVSLEGSAIVERRDTNEKLYRRRVTAAELLAGHEPVPPVAAPLMDVLNSRVFSGAGRAGNYQDTMYNDVPVHNDSRDDVAWEGQGGAANNGQQSGTQVRDDFSRPKRSSTWQDPAADRSPIVPGGLSRAGTFAAASGSNPASPTMPGSQGPGRPTAPKPSFAAKGSPKTSEAVALFTFEADQPGDLAFRKGEVITVTKKTDSNNDWWTGNIGTRKGIFPSNYVKMKD